MKNSGCCNGKYDGNLEYANPMFDSVCGFGDGIYDATGEQGCTKEYIYNQSSNTFSFRFQTPRLICN